jgi:arylsulfatase A-like enzyme/Tfp pilus assembly protein PilF
MSDWRRFRWVAALGLVLAAGAGFWFLQTRPVTSPSGQDLGALPLGVGSSDLNLLLVTLDTTRADRIHAYGFQGIETPHLDRLAAEGVLVDHAVSPAPLTMPAHSTLFTGKSPPSHGVRDNGGFYLGDQETTLAERLKARGFKTGGFIGAYVLDSKWGFSQGFDAYFDDFDLTKEQSLSLATIQRPGNIVADKALEWLSSVGDSRFFAWVHLYDAHSPYEPPEPFKTEYGNRPYVGEIAFVDSQVGRLLAFLDDHDLARRTVVIVMGDHGESLGEHGEGTHGFFVYESVLHVPLLIRAPYARLHGRRVEDVVRGIDVLPTALDLLGIRSTDHFEGQSVTPLLSGSTREMGLDAYSEAVYPKFHFGWSDLRSLRAGRFKYIAAPRPELYDIDQDPHETRNLYEERKSLGDRMGSELEALEREMTSKVSAASTAVELDPDARSRLAALGYVGTFMTTETTGDRSLLADPKDKIQLFNLMTNAREVSRQNPESEEGLKALQEVTRQDPKVIDAWFMIGNEYFRRRDYPRAIENYKRALELKPDYDLVVINMANAYRGMGKDEEAMVGYRRFMELDPKNAQIRYETAQILIDAGRLDEAATELNEALRLEPKMAAARNALGVVRYKKGDTDGAERDVRAAIDLQSDVRLAHFNLALLAEARGELRTAVDEYRREIELHPSSFKAQFNLGKLYEKLGDRQSQLDAFKAAIASNDRFAEGHLFLAKLYLEMGQHLDDAIALAKKGVELDPHSEFAPLGYYILADIYNRQGRPADAAREAALGRQAEARYRAGARAPKS